MNDVKMAENTMTNNLFFLHLQKRCYYILFLWLNLPQKYRQGTLKSYEDSKHEADLELNPVETMPTIKVKTPHTYRIFFVKTQGDVGRSLHFHIFFLQDCYSYLFRPLLMFWSPN